MDFLNMVEKIRDSTAMDSRGFSTLQRIPRRERLYLRLSSRSTSSRITKKYCLFQTD